MLETICYRVGQFLRALTARIPEETVDQAIRILTPEAQALFRGQAVQDQRHALAVYQALHQAGHTDQHLLAAALLHDVGKAAARLPAWQRAIVVLLDSLAPRFMACLSRRDSPQGWRRPFIVHAYHPEIGARWAEEAGCSPLTIALIRRHQQKLVVDSPPVSEEDRLLALLQAADGLD
jgi:hypothetical protein